MGAPKIEFIMPENGEAYPESARELITISGWLNEPREAAESAAQICHNHGAYEENLWPIIIELFSDGESLGKYSVAREAIPSFYATKVSN